MRPPAAERPRVVHTACTLWITGLIVGLIGQYLLSPWTDLTAARARVLASNTSGLTRQQIDTTVTLSVVGALTFAIVLAVVDGWVLTKMRAGRRWARPTLTGLAVLGGLTDLRQGPHLAEALNVTSLLVIVAAVITMYLSAATPYFTGLAPMTPQSDPRSVTGRPPPRSRPTIR